MEASSEIAFLLPFGVTLGAIALAVTGGSFAFTASNTVPTGTAAGEGEGSVSGYTASSVVWTLAGSLNSGGSGSVTYQVRVAP